MTWDEMSGGAFDAEGILTKDVTITYKDDSLGTQMQIRAAKGNSKKMVIDEFLSAGTIIALEEPGYANVRIGYNPNNLIQGVEVSEATVQDAYYSVIDYEDKQQGDKLSTYHIEWRNGTGAGWGVYLGAIKTEQNGSVFVKDSSYNRDKLADNIQNHYNDYQSGASGNLVTDDIVFNMSCRDVTIGSIKVQLTYDISKIDTLGMSDYINDMENVLNYLYLDIYDKNRVISSVMVDDKRTAKDFEGLWIQSGSEAGQGMYLQIDKMNTNLLGIRGVSLVTRDGATNALGRIHTALNKVSANRSKIGAQQNRLEFTINNNKNQIENTTKAESEIRDSDMANEIASHAKENILEQVGQAMLVHANQSTEGILQLLV